jgi:hypothetical protein
VIDINPFDPQTLILIALFNPAIIIVGFLMGRTANQWQKLPVAAFAAALSGFVVYWLAATVGIFSVHALGGEAGIVMMGFVLGLVWATLGYMFFPARSHDA